MNRDREIGIVNTPGSLELAIGEYTVTKRSYGRYESTREIPPLPSKMIAFPSVASRRAESRGPNGEASGLSVKMKGEGKIVQMPEGG